LTSLDALRALLGEYAEGDPAFPGRLTQIVQKLRKQALPILGRQLAQTACPRGLRRTILAGIATWDWPEWVPWLLQFLRSEPDLGVFDDGCAALGALGTREALEALQDLQRSRQEQDRQVILTRELAQFQSQHAFGYHLGRLQEGGENPRLAAQAARILAATATEAEVAALMDVHRDGNPLAQRLALRVLGGLPYPEATAFLAGLLDRIRDEHLDQVAIQSLLTRLQSMPRPSVLPELLRHVHERFGERDPGPVADLQEATTQEGGKAGPALDALRGLARGAFEQFLLETLTLVTEGKVARYAALLAEAAPATEARLAQLAQQGDQAVEILAGLTERGQFPLDRLLALGTGLLRARAGGVDFINAFLRLLPPGEEGLLGELLADPDHVRRQQYLNALGAREEDALAPFFLKAVQDPIIEVGAVAIHHLGKLPSSFPLLRTLFPHGNAEQVRLALWVFKENRTREASAPLLEFLKTDGRDSLLVDAVDALAAIRCPESAPVLLELLHDGKPLNLQVALAQALKQLGTREAALGLLDRAQALKQPQVLILALEGSLRAFPGFDRPLPLEQLPAFLKLLERCCDEREGEGQRLRAVLATQDLYVFDRPAYDQLKDRFSDYLFDMRTKEAWDRDSNDRVAAVVKELARRAEGLAQLAQKEAAIQAQIQHVPPSGPKRIEALLALRDTLQDPALILRPAVGRELAVVVRDLLPNPAAEWREIAHLCEIGGLTRQAELLVEPIREVYQRAAGVGLKSAARGALLALGLEEADLARRGPVRTILVLEPSAFFRKRLMAFLAGQERWTLSEAGSRREAEAILAQDPVDLVLAETKDPDGDLLTWLEHQWNRRRCRQVVVSTSTRDIGDLARASWVAGILFKPYPMEQLLQALEG
jgi:hypothetical protein